ncbi:hypothetical protein E4U55_008102 [Claviceps digitariae]|nr:hypothetical protein E4U55_008102 [Claviceps digitariae]
MKLIALVLAAAAVSAQFDIPKTYFCNEDMPPHPDCVSEGLRTICCSLTRSEVFNRVDFPGVEVADSPKTTLTMKLTTLLLAAAAAAVSAESDGGRPVYFCSNNANSGNYCESRGGHTYCCNTKASNVFNLSLMPGTQPKPYKGGLRCLGTGKLYCV